MITDFNKETFIKNFEHSCEKVQKKHFKKNEIITSYIAKREQFCILLSGSADLVRYDFNGNKTIVEHFSSNDIFGEVFYVVSTNNELFVEAKKNCDVLFYTYNDIKTQCKSNCAFHNILSEALPELILSKVTDLNMRLELLTKRSIREKLIGYFSLLSARSFSKTFTLPFSLTDLADYLSIDRSAMMRELKLLKDDRIIEKKGNTITLISHWTLGTFLKVQIFLYL